MILKYRHNIMKINSIDAFLGIKGGLNDLQRDVYFVRTLGNLKNMDSEITKIDKKMASLIEEIHGKKETDIINSDKFFYNRVSKLQVISDYEDAAFYQKQYTNFKEKRRAVIKNNAQDEEFIQVLNTACEKVINLYKKVNQQINDSIEKNFIVKMLFWSDFVVGKGFADWNEKKSYKIIADNVFKEQEYLFYYMLTLLGCDVLLMERSGDIDTVDFLKELSVSFRIGEYSEVKIPEFDYSRLKQDIDVERRSGNNLSDSGMKNIQAAKEQIEKTEQSKRVKISHEKFRRADREKNSNKNINEKREKSFEELALLAKSVVMIAVHNYEGEVFSTGSGIMIGTGGYILTNCHVIAGGRFFSVRMEEDENVYRTDVVVKSNNILDLAIIKIDKRLTPIPIYLGNKELVRGQKVVAIGSPLGLFNSVSDGIISGFRNVNTVDMIQFTAPISHGSSGGALLNMNGEVIGISTAGFDDGQNLNLAVHFKDINMFVNGFIR